MHYSSSREWDIMGFVGCKSHLLNLLNAKDKPGSSMDGSVRSNDAA